MTVAAVSYLESPVGRLRVTAAGGAIVGVAWADSERGPADGEPDDLLAEAATQLAAYFDGRLRTFSLPLAPAGTPFQQRVWQGISAIPFGRTATYGGLAETVDSMARAVGQACGANPIPIIVPCHRVVARDGLGGWSGGRLADKRILLELEAGQHGLD